MIVNRKQLLAALIAATGVASTSVAVYGQTSVQPTPPASTLPYFAGAAPEDVRGASHDSPVKISLVKLAAGPQLEPLAQPTQIPFPQAIPEPISNSISAPMPMEANNSDHTIQSVAAQPAPVVVYQCKCHQCCSLRDKIAENRRKRRAHMQATHLGYDEFTCVEPFGSSVMYARSAQAAAGLAQAVTLYQYDFYPENCDDASQLNVYGEERVRVLVQKAASAGVPIQIETVVGNPELDSRRRQAVIDFGNSEHMPLPEDMVVLVRNPRSMTGVEAGLLYQSRLRSVQTGGSGGGGGAGAQAGAAGGGTTGTGGATGGTPAR